MFSRSTHRSLAAITLVILCAIPIASSYYVEHRRNPAALPIGEKVSPFTAVLAGGEKFAFDSSRSKNLFLLFYSISCPHCEIEIRNFNSLYRTYSSRLDVIGVCVDCYPGSVRWREGIVPAFPVINGNGIELAKRFRIAAVPSLYCIDNALVLRHRSSGENSFHSDSLLAAEFAAYQ
jgi:peroxiredoxin